MLVTSKPFLKRLKRAKNQTEAVNVYTNYNSYNKTGILSNYFSSLMFFLERYVIK